jgi:hypothetical protein
VNHFQADWHTVIIGCAIILAVVAATITYWCLERGRMAREEHRYDNVQTDINDVPLPEWDGETYDPEQWFAQLREPEPVCQEPPTIAIPVIPASDISGPMPAMATPMKLETGSAEDFIASLTEWNDNFLASIGVNG